MSMRDPEHQVLVVRPDEGRRYELGSMLGIFQAGGAETGDRYCVSTWWLEARTDGPGPHAHEGNKELFFVLEGTMSFLAGTTWLDAGPGTFLRIPAGVTHDFANRGDVRAGVANVFLPGGGFEASFASWVDADRARARTDLR